MNIARYFQIALPFLTLFLNALNLSGNEKAAGIAAETKKYIAAVEAGIGVLGEEDSTVVKGTSAIIDYGDSVLAQIAAVKESSLDKPQKIAEAMRLAATLSDRKIVYQPKKGDDFRALNDYKARALNAASELSR